MIKKRITLKNKHAFWKPAESGFTYLEVIVAFSIVSIALLGLIRMNVISINMNQSAEITAQAVFLAQEKIEEILAHEYPDQGSSQGTIERNALCFDWKTEVKDFHLPLLGLTNASKLREISVDVNWKQGNNRKQLHMSTCVADRKLQ